MDHVDATIALELIGDYWPGKALNTDQLDRWAHALQPFDFDRTCETIDAIARTRQTPPTLAELTALIAPPPRAYQPEPHADGWTPTTRGRAYAAHVRRIHTLAVERKAQHDHRNGAVLCAVCMNPGDYRRCGEPTCPICATP